MPKDLRAALRSLGAAPGFALMAIATLSLAIGGTTAISSFVRGILLAPLPYADEDELVVISRVNRAQGFTGLQVAATDVLELRERSSSFSGITGLSYRNLNLSGGERPERVLAAVAFPDLLTLLGVEPSMGRGFLPDDPAGSVILTHRLWESRFGASEVVVGSVLRHDGEVSTIVGVLPPGVELPLRRVDLIVAMRPSEVLDPEPNASLRVFARLRPDVGLDAARGELDAVAERLEEEHSPPVKGWRLAVDPLKTAIVGEVRSTLLVLEAAVLLALLVACATFANLLLARGTTREREIAVRRALGAGRFTVARQLLTESLLLALAGSLGGIAIARWATDAFLHLAPRELPRASEVALDAPVLVFAVALGLASGALAGALPALLLSRTPPERALRASATSTTSPGSGRLRDALTVAELALALTLTIGAGLLLSSLARLLSVEHGLDASRVLTLELSFPGDRYPDASHRGASLSDVLDRVEALPDVQSVAAGPWTPMTGSWSKAQTSTESRGGPIEERELWPMVLAVSPGYFRTLGIPLREGRDFARDEPESARVAVVSRKLAEAAWPGESALGRRIKFGGPNSVNPWFEVVGVVEDARLVDRTIAEEEAMFRPLLPMTFAYSSVSLLVRTELAPESLVPSLRAAVREVDPEMPLAEIRTLDSLLLRNAAAPRFRLSVVASFAVLAVVLAGMGIYGIVASWASSRRRELGIRIAVGADRRSVVRLVSRQGLVRVALGILLGLATSFVLAGYLEASLFEVEPHAAKAYVLSALFLAAVGSLASFLPARRAARTDPATVLRAE